MKKALSPDRDERAFFVYQYIRRGGKILDKSHKWWYPCGVSIK